MRAIGILRRSWQPHNPTSPPHKTKIMKTTITADFKPAVLAYLARIQKTVELGDSAQANYMLTDLVDDLSSDRVKITQKKSAGKSCPVPAYDAAKDGDYSAWLVSRNID